MKLIITDLNELSLNVSGEHKIIKPEGKIQNCIGCFGCWLKTPGICVIHDGYEDTGIYMGKCSEYIIVSRCYFGSVSPFVKCVQDRALSYIHPDFVIKFGEMHHKQRYGNDMAISAYFYGGVNDGDIITEAEKQTARRLIQANADNFGSHVAGVYFYSSLKEMEGVTL